MATVTVFPNEFISVPEIVQYYSLDGITVPENRPYAWTMSVTTLDGYISFKEPGHEGGFEIALGHIKNYGNNSDYRLLNAGWMFADAVLGSGAILRAEPDVMWLPVFDDITEYRTNVLKKPKCPLNVILSGSGDIDLAHKIFHHPDVHTLVVTTPTGYEKIKPQLAKLPSPSHTKFEVIGTDESPKKANFDGDDFKQLMKMLRTKYDVNFLDVTSGGVVIGALVWHKLVDEMRVTVAGHVCGAAATGGATRTPLFLPPPGVIFDHTNNPTLKYIKIGVYGEHHIFTRSIVQYRH